MINTIKIHVNSEIIIALKITPLLPHFSALFYINQHDEHPSASLFMGSLRHCDKHMSRLQYVNTIDRLMDHACG